MRHIFLIICLMGVVIPVTSSFAQNEQKQAHFFESLYDVPVMKGLEEIPELALSFDKPDGRISQAGAYANDLKKDDILAFYDISLAQMGWKRAKEGIYTRNTEKLEVFIRKVQEKQGSLLFVKFLLKPLKK